MEHSVVILRDSDGGPLLAEVGQDLSLLCNYQVIRNVIMILLLKVFTTGDE